MKGDWTTPPLGVLFRSIGVVLMWAVVKSEPIWLTILVSIALIYAVLRRLLILAVTSPKEGFHWQR